MQITASSLFECARFVPVTSTATALYMLYEKFALNPSLDSDSRHLREIATLSFSQIISESIPLIGNVFHATYCRQLLAHNAAYFPILTPEFADVSDPVALVEERPSNYRYLPSKDKETFEVARSAILGDGRMYKHLPDNLKKSPELIVGALNTWPPAALDDIPTAHLSQQRVYEAVLIRRDNSMREKVETILRKIGEDVYKTDTNATILLYHNKPLFMKLASDLLENKSFLLSLPRHYISFNELPDTMKRDAEVAAKFLNATPRAYEHLPEDCKTKAFFWSMIHTNRVDPVDLMPFITRALRHDIDFFHELCETHPKLICYASTNVKANAAIQNMVMPQLRARSRRNERDLFLTYFGRVTNWQTRADILHCFGFAGISILAVGIISIGLTSKR